MDIDRSFEHHRVFSQGSVDQFASIKSPSGLADKRREQSKFAPRELQFFAIDHGHVPPMIDDYSLRANCRFRFAPFLTSAQERSDSL